VRMAGIFVDPSGRKEQACECHSKGWFRQPLHSTKAMRRARAITADRTRVSLTGGCYEPGIFRIYTEFVPRKAPGQRGQPGRLNICFRSLRGIAGGQGSRAMERGGSGRAGRYGRKEALLATPQARLNARSPGRLFDRGRRRRDLLLFLMKPADLAKPQRQNRVAAHLSLRLTWRARNSPGSVDASHCSFAALAHNSPRGRAALFDSDIGRNRATTSGDFPVMDDVCGSANRVQRPQ
jgi:hypothetical protein